MFNDSAFRGSVRGQCTRRWCPGLQGGTLALEESPCHARLPDDAGQRAKREFGMVRDRNGRRGAAGSLLHHDVTATLSNR